MKREKRTNPPRRDQRAPRQRQLRQRSLQPRANLARERNLYARLFEISSDAHLLVDASEKVVRANGRAAELFGCTPTELAGAPLESLFDESQRAQVQEQLASLLQNRAGEASHPSPVLELTGLGKAGPPFPVEVTLSPLPPGLPAAALCVVRDSSLHVERERRLRKKTELVQFLQDVAAAANEADTITGALQFSVNRLARLLGWPVGHAYLAAEDGLAEVTSIWTDGLAERFQVFKAVSDALRFRAGSGLVGWVLETGQPVWLNNLAAQENFVRRSEARDAGLNTGLILPIIAGKRVAGVIEFYSDQIALPDPGLLAILPHAGIQIGRVVERKQAENLLRQQTAQMRLVMTNLPVIIWMIDREGRLLMLEGKGLQDTGVQVEALLGKNLFDQMQGRPDMLDLFRRGLNGEEVHEEVASNTGAVFETFFVPYYDAGWKVDGLVGLSLNITKRKRLEIELEEMKHRLLESSDMERARLAQQLHDGPLQDLYGAFYQLQEAQAGQEGPQQEVTGRALQTIQGVNATLRMICGELHPSALVHLGLQRAIRGHAERLQERLEGAVLHLDLEDDSPASGSALSSHVRLGLFRIYQQLIHNAARHSRARHIWVRLKLLPDKVTLEVQDNGLGFQLPDHWIDLVRRSQYGLVSALERAQALGGTLEVRSHPEAGALVRVVVPRA